eukprot:EG_transcript_4087
MEAEKVPRRPGCCRCLPAGLLRLCGTRRLFQLFGWLCIAVAIGLTLAVLHVYYRFVFPVLVDLRSWPGRFMFVPATWLSFNILFNYVMVLRTNPGTPSGSLTEEEKAEMEREKAPQKGQGWSKFCKHCRLPKPPRSHHCHACGTCILKMDHHCPWIGGCVGHYNHRYFMLFIVYLGASCLWACITVTLHHLGVLQKAGENEEETFVVMVFTFGICLAVLLAMLAFFGWNAYLMATNQTTIEFHYNRGKKDYMKSRGAVWTNPYDIGTLRNLRQAFGPFKSPWAMLLPSTSKLPLDGTRWETMTDPHYDDML